MKREAIEAFCKRVDGLEMPEDCENLCSTFNRLSLQLSCKREALVFLKSQGLPKSDMLQAIAMLKLDSFVKEVATDQSAFDNFCKNVSLERIEYCDALIHITEPPSVEILVGALSIAFSG